MFSRSVIGIVLLLVLGYGIVTAWPLLSGPEITFTTSTGMGTTTTPGYLLLTGQALHTETLMLNGGVLLIDEQGFFSKTLTLPSGGAILSLTATDRFGRTKSIERTVILP